MLHGNNKGAGLPAHPRSLISAFVVRCLDGMILLVSISEISSLHLVYVAAQGGLSHTWSLTPKTGFLVTRLNYMPSARTSMLDHTVYPISKVTDHLSLVTRIPVFGGFRPGKAQLQKLGRGLKFQI